MTIFRFESEALFAFIERIEHPNSPTPVQQLAVLQRFIPGPITEFRHLPRAPMQKSRRGADTKPARRDRNSPEPQPPHAASLFVFRSSMMVQGKPKDRALFGG